MAMTTVRHQLVTSDGELPEDTLSGYLDSLGAAQWNTGYQVVAIMGPQSSGKSTLMNHVFGEVTVVPPPPALPPVVANEEEGRRGGSVTLATPRVRHRGRRRPIAPALGGLADVNRAAKGSAQNNESTTLDTLRS